MFTYQKDILGFYVAVRNTFTSSMFKSDAALHQVRLSVSQLLLIMTPPLQAPQGLPASPPPSRPPPV